MSTFKVSNDGDWEIKDRGLVVLRSEDPKSQALELVQKNRQTLFTFFGDWYLDTQVGIPYRQIIFQKQADQDEIRLILKNEILKIPGKYELSSFLLDFDTKNRIMTLDYSLKVLEYSKINISAAVSGLGKTNFKFELQK